jgi:hypothetical protein
MVELVRIMPWGAGVWSVKDDNGYFAFVRDQEQATRIGRWTVEWLSSRGHPAELRIERSFAPTDEPHRPGSA